MLLFRRTHTVNYTTTYKSKTNTETVWQYKTFQAVNRLPLAVTEALHTLCDQPWRVSDGRIIILYEISQLYRLCGARSGSPQL